MKTFTPAQLLEIARQQKRILQLILVSILVVISEFVVPATILFGVLLLVAFVAIGIMGTVLIYRLAKALEVQSPWVYVVCAFIPYINTLTLLVINVQATGALKRHGIQVGLMGARNEDLMKLVPAAQPGTAPREVPPESENL